MKFIFLFLLLMSCQLKPTKSYLQAEGTVEKLDDTFSVQQGTVLVDARNPLEAGTDVVSGAVSIWWPDFSMAGSQKRGLLDENLPSLARRLALKGIDRETPVLVLGNVLKGQAEDGRVAWMLKFLGVKKVQLVSIEKVRRFGLGGQKGPENRPYWTPVIQNANDIHKVNFIDGLGDSKVVILDVRSSKEFSEYNLEKINLIKNRMKARLVHLEWKNFFTESGIINQSIKDVLYKQGIRENQTIFVISQQGVRSAAATFALMELGYSAVENVMAGYEGIRFIHE